MPSLVIRDRVKESSTTTGTGTMVLAGALLGFKRFFNYCFPGDRCYYAIVSVDASGNPTGPWETGYGTYGPGAVEDRLERTLLIDSSNVVGGIPQLVNFPAGTKHVWIDWPARQINRTQFRDDNGHYGFGLGSEEDGYAARQKIHVAGNILVEPVTGGHSCNYYNGPADNTANGGRWQWLDAEVVGGNGQTVFGVGTSSATFAIIDSAIALESGKGLAFTGSNLLGQSAEASETHRIHGGVGAPNDSDGFPDGTIYVRQDSATCIYRKESGVYVGKL